MPEAPITSGAYLFKASFTRCAILNKRFEFWDQPGSVVKQFSQMLRRLSGEHRP